MAKLAIKPAGQLEKLVGGLTFRLGAFQYKLISKINQETWRVLIIPDDKKTRSQVSPVSAVELQSMIGLSKAKAEKALAQAKKKTSLPAKLQKKIGHYSLDMLRAAAARVKEAANGLKPLVDNTNGQAAIAA